MLPDGEAHKDRLCHADTARSWLSARYVEDQSPLSQHLRLRDNRAQNDIRNEKELQGASQRRSQHAMCCFTLLLPEGWAFKVGASSMLAVRKHPHGAVKSVAMPQSRRTTSFSANQKATPDMM